MQGPQTITDEEGRDSYGARISRKEKPQVANLVSGFMATVNLLNAKPEEYEE